MKKERKKENIVKPLIFETYLTVVKNSVGARSFRNFYAKINGKKKDIMRNGELSCAFYASSILVLFKFIRTGHATVASTVKDLQKSGWRKISKPKIGSILVWEETYSKNNEAHKHIGFFIGNNKAISNSRKLGFPVRHSWNFNKKRKVQAIFWNPKILSK